MSKYTTGELARLCGVSVRTVQYYDSRGILMPSELSDGGRRIYSEDDLGRMKIICFLRELGIPIDSIKKILEDEDPKEIISLLLDEQKMRLDGEIEEKRAMADRVAEVKRTLGHLEKLNCVETISVESIGDVAKIMENKAKLRRVRVTMVVLGLLMDAVETASLMLWILCGVWLPFAASVLLCIAFGIGISYYYYNSVAYICAKCHTVFKPVFKESFWARHTPFTRYLTCSECGHKGFAIETYGGREGK